jgi:hypothetical protein
MSWLRSPEEATVRTPSLRRLARRARARRRAGSGSDGDRPTSNESSTRLSVVLTDCPPGPEEREKRSLSSPAGMRSQLFTRRSPATYIGCPSGQGISTPGATLAQLASGGTVGTELQLRQQAQDVTQQVADV